MSKLVLPTLLGFVFAGLAQSQVVHRGECVVDKEILRLPQCALETKDGHVYVFREFLPLFFSSGKDRLASAVLPEGGWAYLDRRGRRSEDRQQRTWQRNRHDVCLWRRTGVSHDLIGDSGPFSRASSSDGMLRGPRGNGNPERRHPITGWAPGNLSRRIYFVVPKGALRKGCATELMRTQVRRGIGIENRLC